jgi:hypothetical protein
MPSNEMQSDPAGLGDIWIKDKKNSWIEINFARGLTG